MDARTVILVLGVLGAGLAAGAACAGPQAGSVSFGEADSQQSSSGKSSTGGGTDTNTNGTEPTDEDVFKGSTFTAGTPVNGPAKGKPTHSAVPAPGNATLDPSGSDCMATGCHVGKWGFAGTVYTDIKDGTGVAGAEVRVVGPDGKTYASAYSDADGNFWIASPGGAIPNGSHVGVRNGTKSISMTGTVSGAGGAACNSATGCHGSSQMRIYLD